MPIMVWNLVVHLNDMWHLISSSIKYAYNKARICFALELHVGFVMHIAPIDFNYMMEFSKS
jgi:hypothetical protein